MKFAIKLLTVIFAVLMLENIAHAESPREQLKLMIEQLQKSPNNHALRENIIKIAQKLKPALAVPEEARRSFVRGNTAFSEAKGSDDYARAVQRYEEALVIAPWWGDPYFNLAKALEMRHEYNRAIQSLKFFLLTGPSADDVRKAQDYSYVLEDKQEKLTKEKSDQEAVAHVEEEKYGRWLGNWTMLQTNNYTRRHDREFVVEAKKLGNQILFTSTSGKNLDGSSRWNTRQDFLRATVSPSGMLSWERNQDPPTLGCTDGGWSAIAVSANPDGRSITYTYYALVAFECRPADLIVTEMLTR